VKMYFPIFLEDDGLSMLYIYSPEVSQKSNLLPTCATKINRPPTTPTPLEQHKSFKFSS